MLKVRKGIHQQNNNHHLALNGRLRLDEPEMKKRNWRYTTSINISTFLRIDKTNRIDKACQHRIFSHHRLHLARGNGEAFSASNIHALQTRYLAPMRRCVRHEQLIEGTKTARQARRQADQPQQLLLITTKLANNWQKIVEIEVVLRDISTHDRVALLIIENILSLLSLLSWILWTIWS